jgi:uncharacterized damage-inducible protein DinB
MDSADRLLRLFKYDNWSNEQILLPLQDNPEFENSDKAIEYFAHVAGAQDLWYRRIEGQSLEDLKVWPDYGLPVAVQKLRTLSEKWQNLIKSNRSDLDRIISYQNSRGTPFETMLSDILHHVVIHGQHHRAQIARLLRNAKIEPPATDFIFFCRAN